MMFKLVNSFFTKKTPCSKSTGGVQPTWVHKSKNPGPKISNFLIIYFFAMNEFILKIM